MKMFIPNYPNEQLQTMTVTNGADIYFTSNHPSIIETIRKMNDTLIDCVMQEAEKLEKIYEEVANYPAPIIPKHEVLEIIKQCMEVKNE